MTNVLHKMHVILLFDVGKHGAERDHKTESRQKPAPGHLCASGVCGLSAAGFLSGQHTSAAIGQILGQLKSFTAKNGLLAHPS